jgi:hypothetical protein
MKHPTEQEWMEFLYGELPAAPRGELQRHLESCELCQHHVSTWRGTMKQLDEWRVTVATKPKVFPAWAGAWKWAAAACVIFTSAFATGRLTSEVDPKVIQASVEENLQRKIGEEATAAAEQALALAHQKWHAELAVRLDEVAQKATAEAVAANKKQLEQFSVTLAALRDEDRKTVLTFLQELDAKRVSDLRSLRQQVETMAVMTDQSLRQAERQLVQLASYQK